MTTQRTPLAELLPDTVSWRWLPFGFTDFGVASVQVGTTAIFSGGAGSGKTRALRAVAVQALAREHELVVLCGGGKSSFDYSDLQPWVGNISSGADRWNQSVELEVAAASLERIVSERVNRTVDTRPLTLAIDEAGSLLEGYNTVPEGLEPAHPYMAELRREADARQRIRFTLDRLVRHCRLVNITLVIGVQRFDSGTIPPDMRAFAATRVLLRNPGSGSIGSPETLRMMFGPKAGAEEIGMDDATDGLATLNGSVPIPIRVVGVPRDLRELLEDRGLDCR